MARDNKGRFVKGHAISKSKRERKPSVQAAGELVGHEFYDICNMIFQMPQNKFEEFIERSSGELSVAANIFIKALQSAKVSDNMEAIRFLMERAIGKAPQAIAMSVNGGVKEDEGAIDMDLQLAIAKAFVAANEEDDAKEIIDVTTS